ncbi:MAG: hypothetical protein ACNA8H_14295 [Anaerolineales bacterium]
MNSRANTLQSWNNRIERKKGERNTLQKILEEKTKELEHAIVHIENLQVARSLIQKAAQLTQEKLSSHISDLVSLALRSVFPDPYEFQVVFENRRNSMECDLNFVKDGHEYKPLDSCGYGAADIASFALRVAYWSLGDTRPLLIWDEPFRQLDKKKQPLAAEMVKRLSQELGLQIIIITHSEELAECADKVFNVTIKGGISKVRAV